MIKILMVLVLCCGVVMAQPIPVTLGDSTIAIDYHPGAGPIYVHLHENETTALQAIKKIAPLHKSAWLSLRHRGTRNVCFTLEGKSYTFDPNRIFTAQGIRLSLKKYGAYSPQAFEAVNALATKIKTLIGQRSVIAVHNNKSYSFQDYLPGHALAQDAKYVNFPMKSHYRNFILVTRHQDYCRIIKQRENVIEQHHAAQDDGSLSIYMARSAYVNVEAGYNQLSAQYRMLQKAQKLLS